MDNDSHELSLICNGAEVRVRSRPDRLLVDLLREELGLTGTKLGCGTGDCGACTVLLDGAPVVSCLVYAAECHGREVETIEGVAKRETGRTLVDRFAELGAVQCGICTPGFVVTACALLDVSDGVPTELAVKNALAGNLCRCTGYFPIIEGVRSAAEQTSRQD